jgi:hypothetical protein
MADKEWYEETVKRKFGISRPATNEVCAECGFAFGEHSSIGTGVLCPYVNYKPKEESK